MAKKSRTPPPPRRPVQAPQRRRDSRGRTPDERRRMLWLILFAASGVVALAVVIAVLVFAGGSSKSSSSGGTTSSLEGNTGVATAMRAAGCTYEDVAAPKPPKGQQQHINTLADKVDWNTFPPAAGQHYPLWAVWGFYTDAVNPKQVVHNEEHGGVVLWWGPKAPASEVDAMRSFFESSPNSMFGTPLSGSIDGKSLGSKVAITAWTGDPSTYQRQNWGFAHVAICPTFDESAFAKFRDAYRGHGPEGTPTSSNDPGMGPNG